ncbi:hypothetical protein H5410_053010 [Solanum commersonii]|uniref:Uncharacterized protein n=1 Tax=Solanum commersonii TaxID=4109 RepID=A0A9J5X3S1_SOLCO|nr:hypothetical protein H5410_053010 [Solanum commersonii]
MYPIGPHFKTTHFEDQTSSGAGQTPILPIFEPIGPDGQKGPSTRSNEPQSRIILWMFVKTLAMELVGLDGQNGPFSRSNEPRAEFTIFFGDPKLRCHFWWNFSWTFVNTLVMETIGLDGQNIPFSRSNEPRYLKLWSQLALMAKTAHFYGQMISGAVMEPVGPDGQNDLFSKSNEPWSREAPHFINFCVLYNSLSFLLIQNSDVIFDKFFHGTSVRT